MSKTDTEKRIDKLTAKLGKGKGKLSKKERKSLEAEVGQLQEAVAVERKDAKGKADKPAKGDHHEHLARVGVLIAIIEDPGSKKKARAAAQAELDGYAKETLKRRKDADDKAPDPARVAELEAENLAKGMNAEPAHQWAAAEAREETDAEIRDRVKAKQAARKGKPDPSDDTADDAEHATPPDKPAKRKADKSKELVVEIEGEHLAAPVVEFIDPATVVQLAEEETARAEEGPPPVVVDAVDVVNTLADPEPEQPRDRWDRPLIEPVGGGKPVGYKRTTTYIDVLEDKSNLIDWGRRIVLTGAAALEQSSAGDKLVTDVAELAAQPVIARVVEANDLLAKTAKKADKALAKGGITADERAAIHDAAEKAHKDTINALVQEAFKAGDGFVKAETGTRIHKLTEFQDLGQPLPDDVTESELRDLAAYAAALKALNVEIVAVEQFVVVDELEVGGTLDRRIRYDSPALGRRITAIGDVKTGRVDFGAGKMTRQLAIYAKGKGYDFRKPGERVTFRTNQDYGLIFHVPAGKGICEVYEIDLKKGWEGVQLCAKVWAYRKETSTTAKVFTKVRSIKDAEEAKK